jgi:hypothetical protein
MEILRNEDQYRRWAGTRRNIMPKSGESKDDTVERVMHEYKEGDLKSSSGDKVRNRKQAVAIALSESGQSKNTSKAQNKHNAAHTRAKERDHGRSARHH